MNATTAPARFVLWQEVLFAYLAPAICAGTGGLITGQANLVRAAVTSIAGTSALIALLLGIALQYSGIRNSRLSGVSPYILVPGFGLGAAAGAAGVARMLAATMSFPDRIRYDFPIAAALAAVIITWRWCAVQRKAHA
ncbi:hypothetical protein [Nocardia inohanensis]|uniref:hypothetical protein n=1 Tax=Nocardia inohanensis TaxID=209246 RepID=UPI00082C57ED|nr:hypothetical protein [Nocardia inohanensis]